MQLTFKINWEMHASKLRKSSVRRGMKSGLKTKKPSRHNRDGRPNGVRGYQPKPTQVVAKTMPSFSQGNHLLHFSDIFCRFLQIGYSIPLGYNRLRVILPLIIYSLTMEDLSRMVSPL